MAFDEGLAERIREMWNDRTDVVEKRMFGGIAFMVRGHMAIGVVKDELMVRVDPEKYASLLTEPAARAMDFTGRPMKGFVFVAPTGIETDIALETWLGRGLKQAMMLAASPPPRTGGVARPKRQKTRR